MRDASKASIQAPHPDDYQTHVIMANSYLRHTQERNANNLINRNSFRATGTAGECVAVHSKKTNRSSKISTRGRPLGDKTGRRENGASSATVECAGSFSTSCCRSCNRRRQSAGPGKRLVCRAVAGCPPAPSSPAANTPLAARRARKSRCEPADYSSASCSPGSATGCRSSSSLALPCEMINKRLPARCYFVPCYYYYSVT